MKTLKKILGIIGPVTGLVLFCVALYVLHAELRTYTLSNITSHIKGLPRHILGWALLFTVLNYLILTLYDTLAFRYIGRKLSYTRIAFASFCGYTISNNMGFALISGGAARYRLYSAWGVSAVDITKVILFCTVTMWTGYLALAGSIFTFTQFTLPPLTYIPFFNVRIFGAAALLTVILYIVYGVLYRKPVHIRNWSFESPSGKLIASQIAVSVLDWILAASVLYVLMPQVSVVSWTGFMGIFLFAQLGGIASQLPGGIGVFEALMLVLLPQDISRSQIFGALIAYRGIYYILPLITAVVLIGVQEFISHKKTLMQFFTATSRLSTVMVPHMLALGTLISGAVLLISGSLPPISWRLHVISLHVPLPVIEVSHLLGSLTGAGLLILSRSLYRRIDFSYYVTVALLAAGILFSVLKGLDYEEAIILAVLLLAVLPSKSYFYRKSYFMTRRYTFRWIAIVLAILLISFWIGMFSYKHIEYSRELWWQFTFNGNVSRFLRAILSAGIVILVWGAIKLLGTSRPEAINMIAEDIKVVERIVQSSPYTYANLAFLGDKNFLLSKSRTAFCMYGIEGKSWIVMGDPVGPVEEWPELIWQFREQCDYFDGWPVFYGVRSTSLPYYVDTGLSFFKLGEEARVPLSGFSLEGSEHRKLRYTFNKFSHDGYVFEILPAGSFDSHLPRFREISDTWLTGKNTHEKGFSLGMFREDYIRRFPVGIIRVNEKIMAFTNVWMGYGGEELSVDLMRYAADSQPSVMEYMFICLMLWGKEKGYRWFNMGMSPLSGLENNEYASLWNRFGTLTYNFGEYFYNLKGLRMYKEKFSPVWEPKYLASPGGLSLPQILVNVSSLVSGGIKGIITK